MERISEVTEGVLSVNPNTMYPLLRQLEARGLIEGQWEHPERRSRRYYAITEEGREEYDRLYRGGAPVPRLGRALDRRDRARGLRHVTTARAARMVSLTAGRGGRRCGSTSLAGPRFVEGFAHVARSRAGVARRGVEARSGSRSRRPRRVTEKVTARGRGLPRTPVSWRTRSPASRASTFQPAGDGDDGTIVELRLEYDLNPTTVWRQGPLGKVVDLLFIRRAMTRLAARTLGRFAMEAAEKAL